MTDDQRVYGHCRACHMNCPAYYTVENGRVVDIEPVPARENGCEKLCPRGMSSLQLEYSPTRVLYPQKRDGKRGEGKWKRISWDQALTEIAEKIYDMSKEYGPETFVLPGRTGRQDMGWIACKIARTIGTPNNYYGAIQVCLLPQFHDQVQYGNYLSVTAGTDPDTDLWVTFGTEFPAGTEPILGTFLPLSYQRGMKHIAVDPVCGMVGSKADIWLPIRPGTDLAYCLCIINYLISTDQFATDFVKEWTNAPFLVREDTGALLLESDLVENSSERRYIFWDSNTNSTKYWDAEEICWEGGISGRAHFEECEARFRKTKGSVEISPAVKPESVDPELFGTFEIKLKEGRTCTCKPALQMLKEQSSEWTFEKTAEITGLPLDRIKASCEMIATSHPIEFFQGAQYMATNASQYFLAVGILKALTGNVDVPGGSKYVQFYPVEPMAFPGEFDISYGDGLPTEMKRKRLGYNEHRIGCGAAWEEWVTWHPERPENADATLNFPDIGCVLKAAETGDPYPVHGILAISSNWLMHDPSTARWMKLLEDESKIQLHVVTEIVMTPTAEMADYVLPAATWLERNYLEFGTGGATPFKNFYRKAMEPLGEAKQDYEFGSMLARKLGELDERYTQPRLLNPTTSHFFGGEYAPLWETDTIDEERDRLTRRFFGKTLEECLEERRVFGPDYEAGAPDHRYLVSGKFPTDTGKVNLFSTLHQKFGYPPLPVYAEPAESPLSQPDIAKNYPLVLSTGKRQQGYFHSEFRQLPLVRQLSPVPEVLINPETAKEYGVEAGDWVWVEAPPTHGREGMHRIMGCVSMRFMIRPGQVTYSQHAWWRPEKPVEEDLHGAFEWNCELLMETENSSPETGTPGLRSQLCTIYKCSEEDIEQYKPMITREQLEAFLPAQGKGM